MSQRDIRDLGFVVSENYDFFLKRRIEWALIFLYRNDIEITSNHAFEQTRWETWALFKNNTIWSIFSYQIFENWKATNLCHIKNISRKIQIWKSNSKARWETFEKSDSLILFLSAHANNHSKKKVRINRISESASNFQNFQSKYFPDQDQNFPKIKISKISTVL